MTKKLMIVAASAFALVAVPGVFRAPEKAVAQSGSRTPARSPAAKQAHYDALWAWLKRVDYRKWKGTDGRPPEFQEGQSPHGALIKTYINKEAASDLENLPSKSIIVKENYNPERRLMAITVMQRSKGYDPEHGDWYYAKYRPDGKIDTTPPEMKSMPIAGRFMMCIECHSGADGDDFAFLND